MTKYIPTAKDIARMENLIQMVSEGAVWGTTFGIYRFHKDKKILELRTVFNESEREVIHKPIIEVFKQLGWEVKDGASKT